MRSIRAITVSAILAAGCTGNTPKERSAKSVYDRSDGLLRFVQDNDLRSYAEANTFHLILVNNRSCNCGTPGFENIDSTLNLLDKHTTLWVLSDPDTALERHIRSNGDKFVYPDSANYNRYGLATIDPQIFTIKGTVVTGYVGLKHN